MNESSLPYQISSPLMTLDQFSRVSGLELTVLKAQVNRGYWPTIKFGKRILINVEALRLKLAECADEYSIS